MCFLHVNGFGVTKRVIGVFFFPKRHRGGVGVFFSTAIVRIHVKSLNDAVAECRHMIEMVAAILTCMLTAMAAVQLLRLFATDAETDANTLTHNRHQTW